MFLDQQPNAKYAADQPGCLKPVFHQKCHAKPQYVFARDCLSGRHRATVVRQKQAPSGLVLRYLVTSILDQRAPVSARRRHWLDQTPDSCCCPSEMARPPAANTAYCASPNRAWSRRTAEIRHVDSFRRAACGQAQACPVEKRSVISCDFLLVSSCVTKQYSRRWVRTSGEPIEKQLRLMKTIVRASSKSA